MNRPNPVAARSFDSATLRRALGCFATGVTVVTATTATGAAVGMTANSFGSVSLEPPLVLWCLGTNATHFTSFVRAEYWAVHVLSDHQRDIAVRFAQRGADRFDGLRADSGICGLPLIRDCAARFQCRAVSAHTAGDHVILVGEVLCLEYASTMPLIFHDGRFSTGQPTDVRA